MQSNTSLRLSHELEDPIVALTCRQNPPTSPAEVANVLNGIKCDLCGGKGHSSFSCVNQAIQAWALTRMMPHGQPQGQ